MKEIKYTHSAEPQDAAPTVAEALRTLADLCGERGLYPLNVEEALRALANRPRVDKVTICYEHDDSTDLSGICAVAEVSYSIGGNSRRIERFQSGGLWGIESDSEQDYIEEVEQDELADLKEHLERFGVNTDNWSSLVPGR